MEEENASSFLPFKYGSAMRLVLTGLLSIVVALLQNIKTASLSAISHALKNIAIYVFNSHKSACVALLTVARMIGSALNGFNFEVQSALCYAFSSAITRIHASHHQNLLHLAVTRRELKWLRH